MHISQMISNFILNINYENSVKKFHNVSSLNPCYCAGVVDLLTFYQTQTFPGWLNAWLPNRVTQNNGQESVIVAFQSRENCNFMLQPMNFYSDGVWTSHAETLQGDRYIMADHQEISILRSSIIIFTIKCVLTYYVPREDIWNDDFLKPISPFSPAHGK